MTRYDPRRVAPFGDPRIKAWLAAPRGLSQLPHVLRRLLMPRHPPDTLSSLGNISLMKYRRGASEILGQHFFLRVYMFAVSDRRSLSKNRKIGPVRGDTPNLFAARHLPPVSRLRRPAV